MAFDELLISDPDKFMESLKTESKEYDLSMATAKKIDSEDPLSCTADLFVIKKGLIPFAGHSLGPSFKPVLEKIISTVKLHEELHAGHFPESHPEGNQSGHYFDCDLYAPALKGAQQILGFKEMREFIFTASGLSQNLGMLLDTFLAPKEIDWVSGKTKIMLLESEFFSDQSIATSVMKRKLKTADNDGCFNKRKKPELADQILKIKPNHKGIYNTEDIIAAIRRDAAKLQVICLPGIVFNTCQRLELDKIFAAVKDVIDYYQIKVILDLAHTVGNRSINLEALPVTAAVGCGYKHLCGYAGSGFGIYVNRKVDLLEYPPIQGWKAADPSKVFGLINSYDDAIMEHKGGATAFRTSNTPPIALLPVQTFLAHFNQIGFEKLFNKSECLTRYLIAQLQHHLGDQIEIITPLDSEQRGATIAINIKAGLDVRQIEEQLKTAGFEVDTRPPNIIRMTAHYAYTKFADICEFVLQLKKVLNIKPVFEKASSITFFGSKPDVIRDELMEDKFTYSV